MYSISAYGKMIADEPRMVAYAQALRQAVRPGSVVLDIGSGTGIFALLACKFGASAVYAIEPADAVQVAREIATANNCSERIHFVQDLSTRVQLEKAADVIVSDLRGVLPPFQRHIPSIGDAPKRLLRSAGILIPKQDTVWAAVVEASQAYDELLSIWDENQYEFRMDAARKIVLNNWIRTHLKSEQMVTEPKCWATLDYRTIEAPDVNGTISWTSTRATTAHGLCLWFDASLGEGLEFSNRPGFPELIYGTAFFPWTTPVDLLPTDSITVTLLANLVGDDYIWCWNTRILAGGDPTKIKADFRQSTFYGVPLSPDRLRKQSRDHIPILNEEGK